MVTNRNHRPKRHRLEHPAMIGQGVVIGYQYSLGAGKPLMDRNTGLQTIYPHSPITSSAENRALAYRWNLRQVEDKTNVNLGTAYNSPVSTGVGVCDQCNKQGGVSVVV